MKFLAAMLLLPLVAFLCGAASLPAFAGEDTATDAVVTEIPASAAAFDPAATTDRVMRAIALVGSPYKRGGASPETGFDCSGLVAYVFRDTVTYKLPRSADGLYRLAGEEHALPIEREDLATGDLVFFRIGRLGQRIDHVGIALGDGRFLHAPASGGVVRVDSLSLPYWQKHYAGARRLPIALSVMESPVTDAGADAAVPDATPAAALAGGPAGKPPLSEPGDNPPQP
ncbi:MAG: C40 family peptidase [Gammaproteobacteria bacterium]